MIEMSKKRGWRSMGMGTSTSGNDASGVRSSSCTWSTMAYTRAHDITGTINHTNNCTAGIATRTAT